MKHLQTWFHFISNNKIFFPFASNYYLYKVKKILFQELFLRVYTDVSHSLSHFLQKILSLNRAINFWKKKKKSKTRVFDREPSSLRNGQVGRKFLDSFVNSTQDDEREIQSKKDKSPVVLLESVNFPLSLSLSFSLLFLNFHQERENTPHRFETRRQLVFSPPPLSLLKMSFATLICHIDYSA